MQSMQHFSIFKIYHVPSAAMCNQVITILETNQTNLNF